jgi:uncharacterized protein YcaQ
MGVHQLSRREARRIAIQAQLLDQPRPTDLLDVVRRLTMLQIDPVAAVAPSADLVAWSRLGSTYRRSHLQAALDGRQLIELRAMIRPAEDVVLYRADMANWMSGGPLKGWQEGGRAWVAKNEACRRDVIDRLERSGPLPSRELPDTCVVPWSSTGWTNNKNITKMLELMELSGEVAIAGRRGRERLWDLGRRVYPDEPIVPAMDAMHRRNEKRLHALGLARTRAQETQIEPMDVAEVGEPAVVEGTRGTWRLDPSYLGRPFSGRAALLSPFDRLIHDRKRTQELFEYDYQLEMYKPVAKRRWGYYALPILYGDRLVGKLDATADRSAGVLRVAAVHADVSFTKAMSGGIDREIVDLARWLELDVEMSMPTS